MTDEKNTTPETAKPEPTLTNPVEQSFAEAERLAEQAEAAAKDEPCCDMPKAEEAAPEAPKTEVPTPPQYQPPQYTYAAYTAQPQQPTPQEGAATTAPRATRSSTRRTPIVQIITTRSKPTTPRTASRSMGRTTHSRMTRRRAPKAALQPVCSPFYSVCSGVHNFYIGKTSLGIAQLAITVCSCGTLAIVSEIWGIIEVVRLLQGTIYTDGHGMKFVD